MWSTNNKIKLNKKKQKIIMQDLSTTLLVLRPKNPIPFLVDVLQSIEDVDDENLDYFVRIFFLS